MFIYVLETKNKALEKMKLRQKRVISSYPQYQTTSGMNYGSWKYGAALSRDALSTGNHQEAPHGQGAAGLRQASGCCHGYVN